MLLEMNLLLVAGQTDKKRKYAVDFAFNTIKPALQNIKERVYKTGKFGVNAEELQAIKQLIEFSRDFWQKQTGQLYEFCLEQVNLFYKECEEKRAKVS
jgi:heterodisulfide reductase subunit C